MGAGFSTPVEGNDYRKRIVTHLDTLFVRYPDVRRVNKSQYEILDNFFAKLAGTAIDMMPMLEKCFSFQFKKEEVEVLLPYDEELVMKRQEVIQEWLHDAHFGLYNAFSDAGDKREGFVILSEKMEEKEKSEADQPWVKLYQMSDLYFQFMGSYDRTPALISNRWIAMFGRECSMLAACFKEVRDSLPETDPDRQILDDHVLNLDLLKDGLKSFGTSVEKSLINHQNLIWILSDVDDKWKNHGAFANMTTELPSQNN